jgi:hypothetical protein
MFALVSELPVSVWEAREESDAAGELMTVVVPPSSQMAVPTPSAAPPPRNAAATRARKDFMAVVIAVTCLTEH